MAAGVEVGRSILGVSIGEGPIIRFDNTAIGITELVTHVAAQDATVAVCESTGGYERLMIGRLRKPGVAVHLANRAGGAPVATRPNWRMATRRLRRR